jgi:acetylglutamate kinase
MSDENQVTRESGWKPVIVHPGPPSIENLLRHVDPAPDDETERFVAAIYADRRDAAANLPLK